MANTKQSAKRARQNKKRQANNIAVKSTTKTAVKNAVEGMQKLDAIAAYETYLKAVKTLSKAASKGALPKTRAARKISRLTLMAKKIKPEMLPKAK